MNRSLCSLIVLAAAGACGAASAQDNLLKVGVTRYDTHSKTTGISGVGVPPGADATTGDATTLVVIGEHFFTPNVSLEVVLGLPPRIKAYGSGSVAFLGQVLEAKNLAPTALVNYTFGQPGDALRPYVGVGLNYTRFVGIKSPYAWDVHLGDSWGPVGQVGIDYAVDGHWGLYASLAALKVKSKLVATGATVLTTTIDFRPLVYSAGLMYRF
jgi:outer membrane protein